MKSSRNKRLAVLLLWGGKHKLELRFGNLVTGEFRAISVKWR